jgi:hypothetical protein
MHRLCMHGQQVYARAWFEVQGLQINSWMTLLLLGICCINC